MANRISSDHHRLSRNLNTNGEYLSPDGDDTGIRMDVFNEETMVNADIDFIRFGPITPVESGIVFSNLNKFLGDFIGVDSDFTGDGSDWTKIGNASNVNYNTAIDTLEWSSADIGDGFKQTLGAGTLKQGATYFVSSFITLVGSGGVQFTVGESVTTGATTGVSSYGWKVTLPDDWDTADQDIRVTAAAANTTCKIAYFFIQEVFETTLKILSERDDAYLQIKAHAIDKDDKNLFSIRSYNDDTADDSDILVHSKNILTLKAGDELLIDSSNIGTASLVPQLKIKDATSDAENATFSVGNAGTLTIETNSAGTNHGIDLICPGNYSDIEFDSGRSMSWKKDGTSHCSWNYGYKQGTAFSTTKLSLVNHGELITSFADTDIYINPKRNIILESDGGVFTPTDDKHAVTKAYADTKLALAGGELTTQPASAISHVGNASGDTGIDIACSNIIGDAVLTLNADKIEGTLIKNEDDMSSDSEFHLATQKSIKKYVDDNSGGGGGGSGINSIVEDTTPELGGNLDAGDFNITNVNDLDVDSLQISAGITISNIYDEDDMAHDNPVGLATQQSIKAYVDTEIAGVGGGGGGGTNSFYTTFNDGRRGTSNVWIAGNQSFGGTPSTSLSNYKMRYCHFIADRACTLKGFRVLAYSNNAITPCTYQVWKWSLADVDADGTNHPSAVTALGSGASGNVSNARLTLFKETLSESIIQGDILFILFKHTTSPAATRYSYESSQLYYEI